MSIFISVQFSNILFADHQQYCPGQIQIQRGVDHLLINAPVYAVNQYGNRKSPWGNVVNISCLRMIGVGNGVQVAFPLPSDLSFMPVKWRFWTRSQGLWRDGALAGSVRADQLLPGLHVLFPNPPPAGTEVFADFSEGRQQFPESMSANYGTPGVVILARESTPAYSYLAADYRCAYQPQATVPGPCNELIRQVVYLRPNVVVVYDRIETVKPDFLKRVQWHFLPQRGILTQGSSFTVANGTSKLVGQAFSSEPLTTTLETVPCSGQNGVKQVQQLRTQLTMPAAQARYLTCFQVLSVTDALLPVSFASGVGDFVDIGARRVSFERAGPAAAVVS